MFLRNTDHSGVRGEHSTILNPIIFTASQVPCSKECSNLAKVLNLLQGGGSFNPHRVISLERFHIKHAHSILTCHQEIDRVNGSNYGVGQTLVEASIIPLDTVRLKHGLIGGDVVDDYVGGVTGGAG